MGSASSRPVSTIEANETPGAASQAAIPLLKNLAEPNGSDGSFVVGPQENRSSLAPVTTDFCALPDGSLVELVQPQNRAKSALNFLIWNGETVSAVDHFEHDGHLHTPPVLDQKFSEDLNLRLPGGAKACPAPREFFFEVSQLIRSHVDLPEASICLVAAFVLSTWFVDNLAVVPYLWICGPPGSGKTTLLRLLHCLCRRAALIGGTIPSRVYSLPALLRPTLLLDELQFNGTQHSHALESWLRAGNARGVPVTVAGQLVDSFGAKVLCSRQSVSDTALASRGLHISMVPTRKNLHALDEETVERVANDFQPRLLMFRLQHYREFRPEPLDLSPLSPRMMDLVRALVLPLRDVKEALTPVFDALQEQVYQAAAERAQEPEALVITALFSYCHQRETSTVLVGQIASWVNACRKRIGEEPDLKPRAVGSILKSLGLTTDKLDSFGRGLRLTVMVKRRIHQLLRSYNLTPADSACIRRCVLCEEMMRIDGAEPAKKRRVRLMNI
jgi:energy-coupling factor transporter ATP-binding protein EcfA2